MRGIAIVAFGAAVVVYVIFGFACTLSQPSERWNVTMAKSVLDATEDQLKSAQGKISYLGEQTIPVLTVAFAATGHKLVLNRFLDVQRARKPYANDALPSLLQFSVTPAEFRRMLSAVKPIFTSTGAGGDTRFISFGIIYQTEVGFEGREFQIGPAAAKVFYKKLIAALDTTNQPGLQALTRQFKSIPFPE